MQRLPGYSWPNMGTVSGSNKYVLIFVCWYKTRHVLVDVGNKEVIHIYIYIYVKSKGSGDTAADS